MSAVMVFFTIMFGAFGTEKICQGAFISKQFNITMLGSRVMPLWILKTSGKLKTTLLSLYILKVREVKI